VRWGPRGGDCAVATQERRSGYGTEEHVLSKTNLAIVDAAKMVALGR
jgi:hypothetical protein